MFEVVHRQMTITHNKGGGGRRNASHSPHVRKRNAPGQVRVPDEHAENGAAGVENDREVLHGGPNADVDKDDTANNEGRELGLPKYIKCVYYATVARHTKLTGSTATRRAVKTRVKVVISSLANPLPAVTYDDHDYLYNYYEVEHLHQLSGRCGPDHPGWGKDRCRQKWPRGTLPASAVVIHQRHMAHATPTLRRAAPKMAPAICEAMYNPRRRRVSLPIAQRHVDTTGLKCAPLTPQGLGSWLSTRVHVQT